MKMISPGEVVQISPLVRRITAYNAGVMTGPGTNTYLIGNEQIAVVDPGPCDNSHINTILEACGVSGEKLRWIIVTHTHKDHSPAAKVLAEKTGAQLMGNVLTENDNFQDESFVSNHFFKHEELFKTTEFSLRALHTPGHVDNHLCFLIEEDGMLLTGDHIMQGSTVVIIPPHGNMKAYIESLQLLLSYSLKMMGPGHGEVIEQPIQEIKKLIAHRLGRERKVIESIQVLKRADLQTLTVSVYDDVDSSLHPIARYSLWAHLLKLEKEGRVALAKEQWCYLA